MKNLFLASSFSDVSDVFEKTEESLAPGKTVCFIPTASTYEEINFYIDDAKQSFEEMGLILDILDISTATEEMIASSLQNCDFIYVSGGNTFFLLQELKRTRAGAEILKQIQQGKTYIGESAGTMILSPCIEYVKEMDDTNEAKGLNSYDALNVIDFYPLPHYSNYPFQEVTEKIVQKYIQKIKLEPLTNAQAIRVKGNSIIKYSTDQTCSV
ncbi:MAG: Type 1 glutamine amidotransferase-like domain-containing protein [Bacteroidales bacterium]|nr:Type 1 glutamine amidotransferase-like domain-containing protein [Bacteroidales bacterium]